MWRAGADANTRLKTDVALTINGTQLPAGEYSFLIDIEEGTWTAILSSQPHIARANSREDVQAGMAEGKSWGGYGYDPEHDVLRAPMMVETIENSIDNLAYWFSDVTDSGGNLAIGRDTTIAVLPFQITD